MFSSFRYLAALSMALSLSVFPAMAQDAKVEAAPIIVVPTFGKPQIKILKTEDEPNRHYEKWTETTLVVFASLPPSADGLTYQTQELKVAGFELRLQANAKKSDLRTRFSQLKAELQTAKWNKFTATRDSPQFKALEAKMGVVEAAAPALTLWNSTQLTGLTEHIQPVNTLKPRPNVGYACYGYIIRSYEMEGAKQGKTTLIKAEVSGPLLSVVLTPLEFGRTFNVETGQIEKPKK